MHIPCRQQIIIASLGIAFVALGSIIFVRSSTVEFVSKAQAASGCEMWNRDWVNDRGQTVEQVIGAPSDFKFSASALAAMRQNCIQAQDDYGLTPGEWSTGGPQEELSRCIINSNNTSIEFCQIGFLESLPNIPAVQARRSQQFFNLCVARLGPTDLRCVGLRTEVEACLAGGIDYKRCFEDIGQGRALDFYYSEASCPRDQWSCNGRCATKGTMQSYNNVWCSGEQQWRFMNGCGGSASPTLSSGCGGSCAAGEWSCGTRCTSAAVRTEYNTNWVDGQARWKFDVQQSDGVSCGGRASARKCGGSTPQLCQCGSGSNPSDDKCAAAGETCATVCGSTTPTTPGGGDDLIDDRVIDASTCKNVNANEKDRYRANCAASVNPTDPKSVQSSQATACFQCVCAGQSWTGLGCIDSSSSGGIAVSIMRIVLGVIGGIALILLIIVGYWYNTGKIENIAKAKQQLAAVFGAIVFIIFSVLLLRFIGVNVLDVATPGVFG